MQQLAVWIAIGLLIGSSVRAARRAMIVGTGITVSSGETGAIAGRDLTALPSISLFNPAA